MGASRVSGPLNDRPRSQVLFDAAMADVDPASILADQLDHATKLVEPERALLRDVVLGALYDAALPENCALRRSAREWLSGASARLDARAALEHLGLDYDVILCALKRRWKHNVPMPKRGVERVRRDGSGVARTSIPVNDEGVTK